MEFIKQQGNRYLFTQDDWKIDGEFDFGFEDANKVMEEIDLYEEDLRKPIHAGYYDYQFIIDPAIKPTDSHDTFCFVGRMNILKEDDIVATSLVQFKNIHISRYLNEPDFDIHRYRHNLHHAIANEITMMLEHNSNAYYD